MSDATTDTTLGGALASLLAIWALLAAGALLAPVAGAAAATALTFSAAAAITSAVARLPRPSRGFVSIPCAAASGFASYPAWVATIAVVGLAAGLTPRAPVAPGGGGVIAWLSLVPLAPLFEELLYRRLLLPPLRQRLGAPAAIVLTSVLFAAPHLEPWQVLGTFLVGLALGAVFAASGDVWLCIALHAGLNAAVLACGSPPVRWALEPGEAALAGLVLLLVALAMRSAAPVAPRLERPAMRHA